MLEVLPHSASLTAQLYLCARSAQLGSAQLSSFTQTSTYYILSPHVKKSSRTDAHLLNVKGKTNVVDQKVSLAQNVLGFFFSAWCVKICICCCIAVVFTVAGIFIFIFSNFFLNFLNFL